MQRSKRISFLALVLVLALLVAAVGCGGKKKKAATSNSATTSTVSTTTATTGGPKTQVDTKIAAEVPAKVKSQGTLTVASDATYAPNEFMQGGKVAGMSPDLAQALGKVMGLKINDVNATFDSIIPGLQSGKYDLGVSSFSDTKAREKVVDFVTYFSAGTAFYVKAQGGATINTLADLCGHKVAVERGTTQADDANKQSTKCKSAGKSGVTVQVYPDQNGANLAISSGRAEVGMADSPVAAYIVKQSGGQFKLSGQVYGTAPYGIAIPKGNGMAKPVLDALKKLMANGTYMQILSKWGIAQGAISNPTINGATS